MKLTNVESVALFFTTFSTEAFSRNNAFSSKKTLNALPSVNDGLNVIENLWEPMLIFTSRGLKEMPTDNRSAGQNKWKKGTYIAAI